MARVFLNDDGPEIYEDSEINFGMSCQGYSRPGTSEVTCCHSEDCYALGNSESGFAEDLKNALIEIKSCYPLAHQHL